MKRFMRETLVGGCVIGLMFLAVACGDDPSEPDPELPAVNQEVSGEWPIYRGDPSLTGVASGRLGSQPELAWTFRTDGSITSSPVISDGVVYIGSIDGSLYAIDLVTGKKRWSYATEDAIEASPLVHDGMVYVGSCDGFFYALDATTGALLWKYETDDTIMAGATYSQSPDGRTVVLVGGYDARLYCFVAKSGEKLWSYETSHYLNGTPAVADGKAVFGGCDAVLHVVSVATGAQVDAIELGAACHVAASVAVADGKAYLGHHGNAFVCVDLETADPVWVYPSDQHGFFSSPSITSDRVVFGGRDSHLHCVRREDGKKIWTFRTRRKVDGSPVVIGDKVVFGSGDGHLYLLRLEDGKELWSYEVGRSIFSSPAVAGGMIVIGSNDKSLYAFRAPPE